MPERAQAGERRRWQKPLTGRPDKAVPETATRGATTPAAQRYSADAGSGATNARDTVFPACDGVRSRARTDATRITDRRPRHCRRPGGITTKLSRVRKQAKPAVARRLQRRVMREHARRKARWRTTALAASDDRWQAAGGNQDDQAQCDDARCAKSPSPRRQRRHERARLGASRVRQRSLARAKYRSANRRPKTATLPRTGRHNDEAQPRAEAGEACCSTSAAAASYASTGSIM
jgi:hypothetical protein